MQAVSRRQNNGNIEGDKVAAIVDVGQMITLTLGNGFDNINSLPNKGLDCLNSSDGACLRWRVFVFENWINYDVSTYGKHASYGNYNYFNGIFVNLKG